MGFSEHVTCKPDQIALHAVLSFVLPIVCMNGHDGVFPFQIIAFQIPSIQSIHILECEQEHDFMWAKHEYLMRLITSIRVLRNEISSHLPVDHVSSGLMREWVLCECVSIPINLICDTQPMRCTAIKKTIY